MDPLIDVPDDSSPQVKQFAWVSAWLSKNNLYKTLDTLLVEYDEALGNGLVLEETSSKTIPKDTISVLKHTFSGIHKCSVLSVRFHPSRPWLLSTDTSKNLIISSRIDGSVLSSDRTNNPFLGPIISLDCNPKFHQLLIIGTMDDRHALLEINGNNISVNTLQMWNIHTKYVIRVKWHPEGYIFATASHDGSIVFYKLLDSLKEAQQLRQMFFTGCIESIVFTKDGKYLVASVRGDPCLQYINIATWEVSLANSNVLGDGHVSFTILELHSSPNGKHILASTDQSRAILFQQGSSIQTRNFYGFENDGYSQPRAVFDNKNIIYLTSQDNCIYAFDSNTGQLIEKFSAHTAQVRDIDYLSSEDLIVTCSYDKTIKVWERKIVIPGGSDEFVNSFFV